MRVQISGRRCDGQGDRSGEVRNAKKSVID
jgi:hypothetical protein